MVACTKWRCHVNNGSRGMENNSSSKSICGSEDQCNPRHIAIARLLIIMRLRL